MSNENFDKLCPFCGKKISGDLELQECMSCGATEDEMYWLWSTEGE